MKDVKVKGLIIGKGRPRIVSPVVGTDEDEILKEAMELASNPYVEMLEWRSDKFAGSGDLEKIAKLSSKVTEISKMKPIIFTYRTKSEGGEKDMSDDEYVELMEFVSERTSFDIIDVDLLGRKGSERCIEAAHKNGKIVIGSSHDIDGTPGSEEMIGKLVRMYDMGADIVKMVVKANCPEDTLKLMAASAEIHKRSLCPISTVCMSNVGMITRICGEIYGSCLTYGFVRRSSAGGQIPVEKLSYVLNIVHKSLGDAQ